MRMDLYNDTSHRSIKLRYKGRISFELVDSLLLILLNRLEAIEKDLNVRKKVYSVMMECSQNLCMHANHVDGNAHYDAGCIMLSLTNRNGEYKIAAGNYILNDKVDNLKTLLDEINNHSSTDELKNLYNRKLTNNIYTNKGGGGIGLIDIARKSNEKLHYTFEEIDEKYSFFKLKVRIKKKVTA